MKGRLIKTCLLIFLASVSFNAFAVYLGNPVRPNTIWVPGTACCDGYYLEVLDSTCCLNATWDCNCNRWIIPHFRVVGGY
jgi:hypothetical protein